jgi:glyoxylase I family protein
MARATAERIDHVAIIVTDLERARQFYAGVLGLQEVDRPESFDFVGAWFQIGPTCLHLLGKPKSDSDSPRHFCLWVSDLRSTAAQLESASAGVQWKTDHKIPGIDRFFVHDPDGNRIEFQGPELSPPVAPW